MIKNHDFWPFLLTSNPHLSKSDPALFEKGVEVDVGANVEVVMKPFSSTISSDTAQSFS